MSEERLVDTSQGEARLVSHRSRRPLVTLLLSHGAGNGIEARDLQALATHLPRHGVSVVLLEQPWRRSGRKVATAPPTLDAALIQASDKLRVRTPLVVGGRSAGARSAARCARRIGATGLLALAFPLHPPGKPEKSRLDELTGARVASLVIQGDKDAFGRPEEFPDGIDVAPIPDADHGFAVPKRAALTQEQTLDLLVETTLEWLVREIVGE